MTPDQLEARDEEAVVVMDYKPSIAERIINALTNIAPPKGGDKH